MFKRILVRVADALVDSPGGVHRLMFLQELGKRDPQSQGIAVDGLVCVQGAHGLLYRLNCGAGIVLEQLRPAKPLAHVVGGSVAAARS